MTKQPKEHCAFVNDAGKRCGAYPAMGTAYCIGHAKRLGALPTVGVVDAGVTPVVLSPDWVVNVEDAPAKLSVDEPEALKALRQMELQFELGGGIDPVLATQLSNILRKYMGAQPMGGIELAKVIDSRAAADEQVARAHASKMNLIERSQGIILDHPDEAEAARVEAKVARDIEEAASTYRAKMEVMKMKLRNEPREAVYGLGGDEIYMVNGVKIVVPAEGQWSVPATIAAMHRERQRQRREKKARSDLMQSVPEYSEVYRKMGEIDRQFGSHSQLGGGPAQEEDDFLVAEEIK